MNRFSLNYPPSIDNCRPRKKAKVHWFFTFMLLFSSMPPYIDPKNRELSSLLEYKTVSHPPRNSRRTFAEPNEFSLCVVAMTMPTTTSGKKVRQYRIKVFSTPRWSSRYNRVVPSATLAQVEKSFFLFPTFPSHRAQGEEEIFPLIFSFFFVGRTRKFSSSSPTIFYITAFSLCGVKTEKSMGNHSKWKVGVKVGESLLEKTVREK